MTAMKETCTCNIILQAFLSQSQFCFKSPVVEAVAYYCAYEFGAFYSHLNVSTCVVIRPLKFLWFQLQPAKKWGWGGKTIIFIL